jgi:hypothetical protein
VIDEEAVKLAAELVAQIKRELDVARRRRGEVAESLRREDADIARLEAQLRAREGILEAVEKTRASQGTGGRPS